MTLPVFIIFIILMFGAQIAGISMIAPLAAGLVLFTLLALKRGFNLTSVLKMAVGSLRESFIVIWILILIGCLTGLWRSCGTIAYFITLGVSLMPPEFIVLAAFLLASAMSYAIGTSFGVSATAGVILMSIAKAGGVNPYIAAGAILSGVYVGDRGSPAASSASLVAAITKTDLRNNIRIMLRTSKVPFIICCFIYAVLSYFNPMETVDVGILRDIESEFVLGWYCLIPALLMVVLPISRVPVKLSMIISIIVSVIIAMFTQHAGIGECFKVMVFGYTPDDAALSTMLSGGGIVSMLEVSVILLISGAYGGIFSETGILSYVTSGINNLRKRIGRFTIMIGLSLLTSAVFCNQTISTIMINHLAGGMYGDDEAERTAKMSDIENTVIPLAGMIPWCIACSVPLGMMGVGTGALLFSFYLWLVPLYNLIIQRKKYEHN